MANVAIFIIGLIFGAIICSLTKTSGSNDLINENIQLKDENKELRQDNDELRYAESRAVDYARKLKQIEDIMFGQGTIVDKYDEVVKILKGGN